MTKLSFAFLFSMLAFNINDLQASLLIVLTACAFGALCEILRV